MGVSPKNVNKPYHFPSSTITSPPVRMDAESEAALMGYAEELHAVMVYHSSVSVWMREHAISTTGCSILVSRIMSQSMATQDTRAQKQGAVFIKESLSKAQTVYTVSMIWCISVPMERTILWVVLLGENLHCSINISVFYWESQTEAEI